MAHLSGTIQRGSHARLQEIQGHRLQHVEVMGHLVLHGAGTVDDVLRQNAKKVNIFNSRFTENTPDRHKMGGDLLCKCTGGDSSCSGTQTFPGNKKTEREKDDRVSAGEL